MTCKHDIAEQDTYVADGYCPLCLLDQIQRLQARIDELEARCNHEFPPMKFGGPPRQCLRCGETEGRAIKALEGEEK